MEWVGSGPFGVFIPKGCEVCSYRVQIAANSQNIRTNGQSRQNDFPHISLFLRIFGSQIPSFGNANIWFASVEPTGNLYKK
jgi:hypothetical protein